MHISLLIMNINIFLYLNKKGMFQNLHNFYKIYYILHISVLSNQNKFYFLYKHTHCSPNKYLKIYMLCTYLYYQYILSTLIHILNKFSCYPNNILYDIYISLQKSRFHMKHHQNILNILIINRILCILNSIYCINSLLCQSLSHLHKSIFQKQENIMFLHICKIYILQN